MKLVREVALSRQAAPSFLALTEHEVIKLRQLPGWMRWLFVELVGLSDFRTGKGRAGWPQLCALLDFDRMPGRPPEGADVSMQQIRRAFVQLEAAGLVARDKGQNEVMGTLNFLVLPRTNLGTSASSSDRGSDRGVTASKPRRSAAKPEPDKVVPTGVPTGGSATNTLPLPLPDESYPQPTPTKAERAAIVARVKASIAGGKIKPPQGAESLAG